MKKELVPTITQSRFWAVISIEPSGHIKRHFSDKSEELAIQRLEQEVERNPSEMSGRYLIVPEVNFMLDWCP